MATLLHTADVHLSADAPERMDALEVVLDRAESLGAEFVTIGGDLFHEPLDVDTLRPELRNQVFADRAVEVLVIPGNHDRDGFRGDTYFGEACTPLLAEPFEHYELEDCRITGVPFLDRPDEAFFLELAEREVYDGPEVLLLHCTLDVGFSAGATGDEDERRYCPVSPEQLGALGFEYVLAGHFHQPRRERLPTGEFVYPGTPASTRTSETAPRRAALIDLDAGQLGFESLETFHYARKTFDVLPGRESTLFEAIEDWVETAAVPTADVTVEVEGFHESDEQAFRDRLEEVSGSAEVVDHTITAGRLGAHPLYADFEAHLEARDWDEATADAVRERTLDVLNRVREEL